MADSSLSKFRDRAGKYGLATVTVAAGLIIYVRTEFGLARPNDARSVLFIAFTALAIGMVLSLVGLPRLESFLGLFIFTVAAIFLFSSMQFYNILP